LGGFDHQPLDGVHSWAKRNLISPDALPFVPFRQAAHKAIEQTGAIPRDRFIIHRRGNLGSKRRKRIGVGRLNLPARFSVGALPLSAGGLKIGVGAGLLSFLLSPLRW
jgi:hypothetical protein